MFNKNTKIDEYFKIEQKWLCCQKESAKYFAISDHEH